MLETTIVSEDVAHVDTDDPEVIAQLRSHPTAELVAEADAGRARFRIPRHQLELHFPNGDAA